MRYSLFCVLLMSIVNLSGQTQSIIPITYNIIERNVPEITPPSFIPVPTSCSSTQVRTARPTVQCTKSISTNTVVFLVETNEKIKAIILDKEYSDGSIKKVLHKLYIDGDWHSQNAEFVSLQVLYENTSGEMQAQILQLMNVYRYITVINDVVILL